MQTEAQDFAGPFFATVGTPGRLLCGTVSPQVIGVYRRCEGLRLAGVARLRRLVRLGHHDDVAAFGLTIGQVELDGLWVVEGEEFFQIERA